MKAEHLFLLWGGGWRVTGVFSQESQWGRTTSLLGVAFWEVLVSGLWQNHGTGAGGRNPVPSPLLLFPPPVSCCGHLLVLLPPHQASGGLMEQMICGSEETQDSSEGVFLGGVMLHSDQSFPGIPEQPGSTVGTGPGKKQPQCVAHMGFQV